MGTSSLLQTGEQAPSIDKGHGTDALGPSDSSDTGSDIQGNSGLADDPGIGLGTGTNEDSYGGVHGTAGPDIGDADLDSDSDRFGTGERAGAGRDPLTRENNDIYPDHIETLDGSDDPERVDESVEDIAREVDGATNETDIELGHR